MGEASPEKAGVGGSTPSLATMKYVPLFEKVISPKKTALWYQIDRRVDLLINLQLSTQIPMVKTTN